MQKRLRLFAAASLVCIAATAVAREPVLKAASALVLDDQSDTILLAKNAEQIHPIASITKLLTVMTVLDAKLDPHEPIELVEDDQSTLKFSRSRLAFGTTLPRGELMRLALMASDNRAAAALARTYPGGTRAAVAAMNAKARALGLAHTSVDDPTGLSPNNVSTARDLAKLIRAAVGYRAIREYSTTPEYEVSSLGRTVAFRNTNALTRRGEWDIDLSKTGFITEAGRCLVLHVRMAARPVTIVLLDAVGKYTPFADAHRIRQWLEPGYTFPRTAVTQVSSSPKKIRKLQREVRRRR